MAEYPDDMQDEEDLRHNSLGTNPSTDPPAGRKDDGWAVNDIPPSSDENWFRTFLWTFFLWVTGNHIRAFDYIFEAIGDTNIAVGQEFQVRVTGANAPLTSGITIHATDSPDLIVTDGWQVYAADNANQFIQAYVPTALGIIEGQQVWKVNPFAHSVSALAAPGEYVYVCYNSAGGLEKITALDPDGTWTGAVVLDAYAGAITRCVANASYVAFIRPDNRVEIRDAGTLLNPKTWNPAVAIHDICIDDEYVYATHTQFGGGFWDVSAIALSSGVASWQNSITVGGGAEMTGICCDGEWLYLTGGVTVNFGDVCKLDRLKGLDALTGAPFWERSLSSAATKLECDEKFLYLYDPGGPTLQMVDKREGGFLRSAAWAGGGALTHQIAVEGMRVFGVADTGANDIMGIIQRGSPTKTFIKVDATDDQRSPFYNLAVPVDNQR